MTLHTIYLDGLKPQLRKLLELIAPEEPLYPPHLVLYTVAHTPSDFLNIVELVSLASVLDSESQELYIEDPLLSNPSPGPLLRCVLSTIHNAIELIYSVYYPPLAEPPPQSAILANDHPSPATTHEFEPFTPSPQAND